jgi:alanyl-tRNA synthetase
VEGYNEVGNFLLKIMDLSNRIVVFFDGTRYLIASHKYDVRPMIKKLMEVYGGRGGGKAEFANYQPEKKMERSDFERICSEVYQI